MPTPVVSANTALLYEDDPVWHNRFSELLNGAGFQVQALEKIQSLVGLYNRYRPRLLLVRYREADSSFLKRFCTATLRNRSCVVLIFTDADGQSLAAFSRVQADDCLFTNAGMQAAIGRLNIIKIKLKRRQTATELDFYGLFEKARDGMLFTSPTGRITRINKSGAQLLGFTEPAQAVGHNIGEYFLNHQDRDHAQELAVKQGFLQDFEFILQNNLGKTIFVLGSIVARKNTAGVISGFMHTIKDISQRIKQERAFMLMNCELAETNEKLKMAQNRMVQQEKLASIGQLAAGVAHEINNPLGFIKSNLQSLKNYHQALFCYSRQLADQLSAALPEGSKIAAELGAKYNLDFIQTDLEDLYAENAEGFTRIINIIHSLRTFSTSEESEAQVKADINLLVGNTLTMAWNEIKYTAQVVKELKAQAPLLCRPTEITQVLLNILINSVWAIKQTGRKAAGEILIRTYEEPGFVVCAISDNGCGITPSNLPHIFEPFFTTKETGQGMGLGLSIAYDIITSRHGGLLEAVSEQSKGTTFYLKLPRQG